jgi:hypothetical protein
MLPTPAVIQLDEVRPATLGQVTPFVRDRIECMGG